VTFPAINRRRPLLAAAALPLLPLPAFAQACLQYLCTDAGQELAARHHLRPHNDKVLAKYAKSFASVNAVTVDAVFGGWTKAQRDHFNDSAPHDQVIAAAKGR
jgi:sulfate transport system substrate-binding protein